jgi:large conductance mechanosensitive channel
MARTYQRADRPRDFSGEARWGRLALIGISDRVSPNGGSAVNTFLSDFKKFVMQGDLVSVAVAFIIGLSFKKVVDSLVDHVFTPLIGAIFGEPSFNNLTFKIGDGVIAYGLFVNAIINFLITAATLFVIVRAYESLKARRSVAEKEADPSELDVLTEIRDLLAQSRAS